MSKYDYDLPFVEEDDDIIVMKHLTKHFPIKKSLLGKPLVTVKAVTDISLKVKKGTTLGVVGESGCGKTTMGRTILRLYDITSGQVIYKGLDLSRLSTNQLRRLIPEDEEYSAAKSGSREELLETLAKTGIDISRVPRTALSKLRPDIQIIFQDPYSSLSPRMTIGSIIGEAVKEHHIVPKEEYRDYVIKIMKECGLQPYYFDRYPHEFSGGQRQRICIARALALNPKVVICDEPVSALDVSIQAQIINLLKDLQKEHGITYVFISHDLSVVKHISTDVAVMYLGSLMEKAPTNDIFDNPMHPYTKALLSAVPVPDPSVKMKRIILEGDIPSPANPPSGCKFHTRCRECMEICRTCEPQLKEYEPGHYVACHLYDENLDQPTGEENGTESTTTGTADAAGAGGAVEEKVEKAE